MEDRFSLNEDVLFLLANQVAEAFAGSAAIEDLSRNVLAYSTLENQLIDDVRTEGILMRRVPDDPENDQQYREVLAGHSVVRFPPSASELGRVAIAIKAGNIPLGTLWVVDRHPEQQLTEHQRETLHHSATQAAPVLLGREHRMTTHDLPRRRLFLRLLTERLNTELREVLMSIAFPQSGALVIVQAQNSLSSTDFRRLTQAIIAALPHVLPSAVAAATNTGIRDTGNSGDIETETGLYIFLPGTTPGHAQHSIEQLQRLVQSTGNQTVRCFVVKRFLHAEELSDAHEYAKAFLRASLNLNNSEDLTHPADLIEMDDQHSSTVSRELTAAVSARPWLHSPRIAKFCEDHPDAAHTVQVWCEEIGNVARTSKRLHIHENTVRFRLEKARNDYGISLSIFDDLMAFVMQYRSTLTHP